MSRASVAIPVDCDAATLEIEGREVHVTNLRKIYFPEKQLTKRDLLAYYASVAPFLLPHIAARAMVMKRYPNGIHGPFFYMKRTPVPHPSWLRTCAIEHASGNVIHFPVIDDTASLLWLVNLGCIDLHPWYARCDDVRRPDYLHFDLDPGSAPFANVREAAFVLRDRLRARGARSCPKTSGSKGIHVYVPIERGPTQHEVWALAKAIARELADEHPKLLTAEYRVGNRPPGRVLIDYNQNAFGRTLASVYSVRPNAFAGVSMPVEWSEIERGIEIETFTFDNALARVQKRGDLWAPLAPNAADRVVMESLR